jgi:hypothetical protein
MASPVSLGRKPLVKFDGARQAQMRLLFAETLGQPQQALEFCDAAAETEFGREPQPLVDRLGITDPMRRVVRLRDPDFGFVF